MAPNHMDILNSTLVRDAKIAAATRNASITKQEYAALPKEFRSYYKQSGDRYILQSVAPAFQPAPSTLFADDDDPFGGNSNNRRVAERIVADGDVLKTAPMLPTNPVAAKAALNEAKKQNAPSMQDSASTNDEPVAGAPVWTPNS